MSAHEEAHWLYYLKTIGGHYIKVNMIIEAYDRRSGFFLLESKYDIGLKTLRSLIVSCKDQIYFDDFIVWHHHRRFCEMQLNEFYIFERLYEEHGDSIFIEKDDI